MISIYNQYENSIHFFREYCSVLKPLAALQALGVHIGSNGRHVTKGMIDNLRNTGAAAERNSH